MGFLFINEFITLLTEGIFYFPVHYDLYGATKKGFLFPLFCQLFALFKANAMPL